jgi:hypothetical protein
MSEADAYQDEMRRLLLGELGSDPLAIDQDTADRLLAGRLDPADAPPGYAEVARVLAAAAAPTHPHELDSESTVVAAFAAARLGRDHAVSHAAPRRSWLASKLAVVSVAVGVLMGGGVAAAAAGTLPEPAQRVVDSVARTAHHVSPWSPTRQEVQGRARSSGNDQRPAAGGGRPRPGRLAVGVDSTGPGAAGLAKRGACAAPSAGPAGARDKHSSTEPQAAASAAGGAGKVAPSCHRQAAPSGDGGGSDLRHPETGAPASGNGRAAQHRKENGE